MLNPVLDKMATLMKSPERADRKAVVIVENVGNLICPTDFPLGLKKRVMVVSTTEGDHVVRKHPLLVKSSDILVINKVDLKEIGAVDSDIEGMEKDARDLNSKMSIIRTSAKTGAGLDEFIKALGLTD